MRTLVIIKSANAFSSIIKMKLCFNLKDTMYFPCFLPSPEKSGGRGEGGNGTCLCFPLGAILKS